MTISIMPMSVEHHWLTVQEKIGLFMSEDTRGIVAIEDDTLSGAIVFQAWSHSSAMVHIWVDSPMVIRRGLLTEACRYFFDVCGKTVMIGMTVSDNYDALRFIAHIGFKEKYRIKDGFRNGVDWVLQEARREDLGRWVKPKEEVAYG